MVRNRVGLTSSSQGQLRLMAMNLKHCISSKICQYSELSHFLSGKNIFSFMNKQERKEKKKKS